jgi:peptide/nickel transport system substrate-binding protein
MARSPFSRRHFLRGSLAVGLGGVTMERVARAQTGAKVLRAHAYGRLGTLDPGSRLGAVDENVMQSIYCGLVRWKQGEDWKWELDLASAIEQVDPTHIRFELKPGMAWSDGFGEVTAEDVKFSYERLADPANKSAYRGDWEKLDRVDVTGTHSGLIVLKEPFTPIWGSTLPTASGLILCKKAVQAIDGQRIGLVPPAVCGPYRVRSVDGQNSITLERNPLWRGERPDFDEVRYIAIVDANAAEIAFQAGELDIANIPATSVPRLKGKLNAGQKLVVKPSLAFWWLGMQSEVGIFSDIRVRKAVQLAVDVDAVLDGAFFGVVTRSTGVIAPGLIGHRPKNKIERPNLDQARRLLAEAGHGSGLEVEIGVRNSPEFVNAAQIVASNLAAIDIRVQVTPYDTGIQKAIAGDKAGGWKKMQLIISRFSMQPDPSWATVWFTSAQIGEWNYERFSNPEFDDLHVKAQTESDPKRRDEMYVRMQDLMEESGSYVFLTHGVNAQLYRGTIEPALSPDAQRFFFHRFKTV